MNQRRLEDGAGMLRKHGEEKKLSVFKSSEKDFLCFLTLCFNISNEIILSSPFSPELHPSAVAGDHHLHRRQLLQRNVRLNAGEDEAKLVIPTNAICTHTHIHAKE